MKKNAKKYLSTDPEFPRPLSAAELNELCVYESWLPALPETLFFTAPGESPERTALRAYFKKSFLLLQQ